MTRTLAQPATSFALPGALEATAPPERRGLARDAVRLLVGTPKGVMHHAFHDLPSLLHPGDLVVVNTSATLPAAVDLARGDRAPHLHVAATLDDGSWVVERRLADRSGPDLVTPRAGAVVELPGGLRLTLVAAHPDAGAQVSRLWRATPSSAAPPADYLARHGRPIAYAYSAGPFPLADYQTVFGVQPGSAEMASAARPFTPAVVVGLARRGVAVAPVVLHCGVSSPEPHEPPMDERFAVPAATARAVNSTRTAGGRVVAVGTTVTRALETVAAADGSVTAGQGWTSLVLGPERPARVVTGLVTGLHAPQASHLSLLEAVAGPDLVRRAYDAALRERYLWHEFGDASLFLP